MHNCINYKVNTHILQSILVNTSKVICTMYSYTLVVLLFRFPLDNPGLLQKWLSAMAIPNFHPKKHHMLCSDHFEPCMFRTGIHRHLLCEGAVPSRFQRLGNDKQVRLYPLISTEKNTYRQISSMLRCERTYIELNERTDPQSSLGTFYIM